MMRYRWIAILLVAFAFPSSSRAGNTAKGDSPHSKTDPDAVERACLQGENHKTSQRTDFEKTLDGKWEKSTNRGTPPVYSWLSIFRSPDGRVCAKYSGTSPADDWVLEARYCFRKDGTIAARYSDLHTSNNANVDGYIRVRIQVYYDESGKPAKSKQQVTGPNGELIPNDEANFQKNVPPVFLTVGTLLKAVKQQVR